MFQKPNRLKKGDRVGIFIPASPVKKSFRQKGLKQLKELGYSPVEVTDILARNGYLAKSPGENFNDIQLFFNRSDIAALWAARGGYGCNHLLPLLKKLAIPVPKIVIGSSDLSVLLWYLMDRFRMVVFYGPMVYSALAENRANTRQLPAVLEGLKEEMRIRGKGLVSGRSRGILTGGCLSNLVSLIGTPFFPDLSDRILLLEDTGERPYRLDRMFWQLYQNGVFQNIRGLVLGQFPRCFRGRAEKIHFFSRVKEYLNGLPVPVIYDLPLGHSPDIHTVPLGIEAAIDSTERGGLLLMEKGVL